MVRVSDYINTFKAKRYDLTQTGGAMKLRELMRYIEHNQKIIIRESLWKELFKGTARQVNLIEFGERNVKYLIVDNDIYTRDYLKIEIEKE